MSDALSDFLRGQMPVLLGTGAAAAIALAVTIAARWRTQSAWGAASPGAGVLLGAGIGMFVAAGGLISPRSQGALGVAWAAVAVGLLLLAAAPVAHPRTLAGLGVAGLLGGLLLVEPLVGGHVPDWGAVAGLWPWALLLLLAPPAAERALRDRSTAFAAAMLLPPLAGLAVLALLDGSQPTGVRLGITCAAVGGALLAGVLTGRCAITARGLGGGATLILGWAGLALTLYADPTTPWAVALLVLAPLAAVAARPGSRRGAVVALIGVALVMAAAFSLRAVLAAPANPYAGY
jgi:hypothetical protein